MYTKFPKLGEAIDVNRRNKRDLNMRLPKETHGLHVSL